MGDGLRVVLRVDAVLPEMPGPVPLDRQVRKAAQHGVDADRAFDIALLAQMVDAVPLGHDDVEWAYPMSRLRSFRRRRGERRRIARRPEAHWIVLEGFDDPSDIRSEEHRLHFSH